MINYKIYFISQTWSRCFLKFLNPKLLKVIIMNNIILPLLFFMTTAFGIIYADGEKIIDNKPQEIIIKSNNKKLELFKAFKSGISGTVALIASYFSFKIGSRIFEPDLNPEQRFFVGLNVLITLTLLDLGYAKCSEAYEAFTKVFGNTSNIVS
jgi:hypothetical protein